MLYRNFISKAAVEKSATLSIKPASGTYEPNDTITANVRLDTGNAEIATVGAEIGYDKDVLKLTNLITKDSELKMWMPTPDPEEMQNGKITFLGSTNTMSGRRSFSDNDGQIIGMEFKVKAGTSGTTKLEFNKDNSGVWLAEPIESIVYNVLGKVENAQYTIGEGGGEVPLAPTGLKATSNWYSVTLEWNKSAGATGYKVYYGTESGKYGDPVDVGSKLKTVLDEEYLVYGTKYYFVVTAYNNAGESKYSNEVTGKPHIPGDLDYDKDVDDYDPAPGRMGDYHVWITYLVDYTERGVVDDLNRDGDLSGAEKEGQAPKPDGKINLDDFQTWVGYWIDWTQGRNKIQL